MEIALTSVDKITFKVDSIVLDAVIRENHSLKAKITKHPIEEGGEITDHMSREPDRVEMECEVTNTPVHQPQSHADGAQQIGIDIPYKKKGPINIRLGPIGELDPLASNAFATVIGYDMDFDRVRNVWQELRDMVGKKVVTIVTSLGEYTDMGVESVDAPRENSITEALRFTATFVEMRTVSSRTVEAPEAAIPQEKIAIPKRRVGKAPPQPVTPTEQPIAEEASESFLHSLF